MRWLLALLSLALALPASASAGTAGLGIANPTNGERDLLYTAAPGERNRLTVRFEGFQESADPGAVVFSDAAGISAGAGCVSAGTTVARCPFDPDLGMTRVLLGDGDDTAGVLGNDQSTYLDGGTGDDSLRGGPGNDAIDFGNGPVDTLIGGPGNDLLRGASAGETQMPADPGSDGRDVYVGGKGIDTVSYAARREPLSFRFNAAADDGAAGEGDRIGTGIDKVVAGAGEDRLIGDAEPQGLSGGPGRDVIRGGGGGDALRAGGGAEADALSGGAGDDLLEGNAGPNILVGGRGFDRLAGQAGDDRLGARDGGPDAVFCGKGRDRAEIDGHDFIPKGCERHRRRRLGAAVLIQRESESDSDTLTAGFRIGCPVDGPRRCKGRLYLRERGGRRYSQRRFSLPRGRIGAVRFGIIEGDVRLKLVTRDRRGRLVTRRARGHVTEGPTR